MYIEITTRCNMMCDHCAPMRTAKGQDMDQQIFDYALEVALQSGYQYIALGGGEPTLHPNFAGYLEQALEGCKSRDDQGDKYNVLVVTNGKNLIDTLYLAEMVQQHKGRLRVDISTDKYHEAISQEVKDLITKGVFTVRNVEGIVIPQGRALHNSVFDIPVDKAIAHCPCAIPTVRPTGELVACGCTTSGTKTLGHVNNGGTTLLNEVLLDNDESFDNGCWNTSRALLGNRAIRKSGYMESQDAITLLRTYMEYFDRIDKWYMNTLIVRGPIITATVRYEVDEQVCSELKIEINTDHLEVFK